MPNRRRFITRVAAAASSLLALPALAKPPAGKPAAAPPYDKARPFMTAPRIDPELKAHGAIFDRHVHKIGENVYSAVGWSGCNSIMVVGRDGVIIVDTGSSLGSAQEAAGELRKITDKPVRAIVYTSFHLDHINGVKAYASDDDVASGRVMVIAHETLVANVRRSAILAPVLGARTAYNFGAILSGADIADMNLGSGPIVPPGEATFIAPTKTFRDTLEITVCGIALRLLHVPSESADQIAVFLPDSKILLSAEVIPAQCFPVLHPLRGEAFRDPVDWYESIDKLRRLEPVAIVPSHGVPIVGPAEAQEVMCAYRDAIQYVHDQTIRLMNKGLTPDELAESLKLPPRLANYKPWLQEFCGSVSQATRAIYQGQLGWFEGDPVALAPIPRLEKARREIALMGGAPRVFEAAETAFRDGDFQWAAELATRLVRVDYADWPARRLKAAALRSLGYAQANAIWRNWYLSAALELDREGFNPLFIQYGVARAFTSPDLATALPARAFIASLPVRLRAEDALDVLLTIGFHFPNHGENYAVAIRQGVAEILDFVPDNADASLTLDKPALSRIRLGQSTIHDILAEDRRVGKGSAADIDRFFSYFETPFSTPIWLAVR